MPLLWDVKSIENHEEQCYQEADETGEDGKPLYHLNPLTEQLIWLCGIYVGIPKITEENLDRWYNRYKLMYDLDLVEPGAENEDGELRPLTKEEVRSHIGLSTNGIEVNTDKFFRSKLRRALEDERGKF